MKALTKTFISCFVLTLVSCAAEKYSNSVENVQTEKYVEVLAEPLIVRVQSKEESKLASLSLSYQGRKNIQTHLKAQKETVQNLIIQALGDFKFEHLSTDKGKLQFQKTLLTSLNQFVDAETFVKINVLELKEI